MVDRTRYYACGLDCPQPDLLAIRVEQDLLLPAMVRAHQVLYGVGRQIATDASGSGLIFTGPTPWRPTGTLVVSSEELRRWQHTDPRDHRAMLLAAYMRVTVDAAGTVTPVWRPTEGAAMSKAAGATHSW
ncbi:MAG: hypothetical protein ACRDT6_12620 [Micromonosporaceae bacterium]